MNQSQKPLTWSLLIEGQVQGVGYRRFAQRIAQSLGLGGWTQNLPDGRVEICVSGQKPVLELYLAELKKGPPLGKVAHVVLSECEQQNFNGFFIHRERPES